MNDMKFEIWADSFHEGEWCCDNLSKVAQKKGFNCRKEYEKGFLPKYYYENSSVKIEIEVYGSYDAWKDVPKEIRELIQWGKPDFIAYAVEKKHIVFAVEETSATMTGNQPLQRCERQYGSAIHQIPYWYLVSEYGVHLDGGTRRDSIWPSISAFKLSNEYETPNIVLHYSGEDSPEDYKIGKGLHLLFEALFQMLVVYSTNADNEELLDVMENQYAEMIKFVNSQWENIVDFIPSRGMLNSGNTARLLAYAALGKGPKKELEGFLQWPLTTEVAEEQRKGWKKAELLTYNKLSALFEEDIENGKCYILSNNAASGRPPKETQIKEFLIKQKKAFESAPLLSPPAYYNLELSSFSKTVNGNYNLTTSKNIMYLYDRWSDLKDTIIVAYERLKDKLDDVCDDKVPAMVYISNSLAPRRIFGDPFIGQLAAYAVIFGKFDKRRRLVVAYYPHQSYTYFKEAKGKGKKIITDLVDIAIFAGGVAIDVRTEEIL